MNAAVSGAANTPTTSGQPVNQNSGAVFNGGNGGTLNLAANGQTNGLFFLNLPGAHGGNLNFSQIFTCSGGEQLQVANNQSAISIQQQAMNSQVVTSSTSGQLPVTTSPTGSSAPTTAYMLVPVPIQQLPQLAATQLSSVQSTATSISKPTAPPLEASVSSSTTPSVTTCTSSSATSRPNIQTGGFPNNGVVIVPSDTPITSPGPQQGTAPPINDPQITSTNLSPRTSPAAGSITGLDNYLSKAVTDALITQMIGEKCSASVNPHHVVGKGAAIAAQQILAASSSEVLEQLTNVMASQQEQRGKEVTSHQMQQQWAHNLQVLHQSTSTSSTTTAATSAVATSSTACVTPRSKQQAQVFKSSPSPSTSVSPSEPTTTVAPPKREKRKKGPAPKLDGHELCQVCGDKASGYHYGVLSCEGCKGFFRRAIINKNKSTPKCKKDGNCEMDPYMRRKCPKCRMDKCRKLGMMEQKVLSEFDGRSKRQRKEKCSDFVASPTNFAPNLSFHGEPVPSLTSHQRNLVEMLQANEQRFQWPTQEDVDKVTPWVEGSDSHRSRASRFAHFTELAILIVQLVVEFTKHLPGFLSVSQEDQIVLLKACTIEVMLLRAAKQYDKRSKAINFLNGKFYDKNSFYRAGMQREFVDPIFDFCNSMAKLDLDEAEFALLVAINTFSADRPNIKDKNSIDQISKIQDSYVKLLDVYTKIHRPQDPLVFPRILMKLVELRTLNNYHSEQIFALKVQDKQLPPLLAEIWDM